MDTSKPRKRMRNPVHEQRRAMVNGMFPLPDETFAAMKLLRAAFQKCADEVLDILDDVDKRDEGRVTAVLDQIQAAKNTACDSIILPYGPTAVAGSSSNDNKSAKI